MKPPSGYGGPGPGRRSGLINGFLHNLCTAICSCCYVFSCCWLVEDCFSSQRSFPWPAYGSPEPPPPPPTVVTGHQHHGLLGSVMGGPPGPPGPFGQPGPYGYSEEPPPYR
ncbi:uncharacterized protein LOC130991645 [Salvia miltiorrhiza]|uniref:uncharacterized protein LOC130991645 n=1 Tax=Salvia miltiorrhiza TaxID=226208 RepID=UPI0025ACA42E|nr:uncharacterized protein LOC130991645 [Salvia miltiorrhiza]